MSRSMMLAALAAVVLLALVFVFVNPFQDQVRKDTSERGRLFDFNYDAVDGIEVQTASETISLARGNQGWVVTSKDSFPADTIAVAAVLEAFEKAEAGAAVSRNPEKRTTFEVTDELGVRVMLLKQGETVAEMTVGKPATDFTASYVQVQGEDGVYQVRGVNRNMFNRGRGYRDRALTRFNTEAVTALSWAAADTGWTAVKQDSLWQITSPDGSSGTVSPERLRGALRAAATLTADGFAPDSAATGLDGPTYMLTVEFQSGDAASLLVGAKSGSQYYASRPDRDAVYLLSEWNLNQLKKRAADFLAGG